MDYMVNVETPHNNREHLRMMINAVDAVISGKMSQREAAKAFNIPRSTLRSHLPKHATYKHKIQNPPAGFKGKTMLTKKEEKELVDVIINMYRAGFGRTRQDVFHKVQDMLNKAERKTKFENNLPNDEWFDSFLERHKDSIKECFIGCGIQEKGVVPIDVFSMEQALDVQPLTHQQSVPSAMVYHHPIPQQQPHQLQLVAGQPQIHQPQVNPEIMSRSRMLPFPFQM